MDRRRVSACGASSIDPEPARLARYIAASAWWMVSSTVAGPVTSAIPMAPEIDMSPSGVAIGSATCLPSRSQNATTEDSPRPSQTIMNSSPPRRATVSVGRTTTSIRRATSMSTSSPVACPWRSFTDLKWSRSTKSAATGSPVRELRPRAWLRRSRRSTRLGSPVSGIVRRLVGQRRLVLPLGGDVVEDADHPDDPACGARIGARRPCSHRASSWSTIRKRTSPRSPRNAAALVRATSSRSSGWTRLRQPSPARSRIGPLCSRRSSWLVYTTLPRRSVVRMAAGTTSASDARASSTDGRVGQLGPLG